MNLRRSKPRLLFGVAAFGVFATVFALRATNSNGVNQILCWLLALGGGGLAFYLGDLLMRNRPVAVIDDSGVALASMGMRPIPWMQIDSFRAEVTGDGGTVVVLELKAEAERVRRARRLQRLRAMIRRWMGFAPYRIHTSGLVPTHAEVVAELRKRIPER